MQTQQRGADSAARGLFSGKTDTDSAARHSLGLNSLGTQQRGDAEARRRSGAAKQEGGEDEVEGSQRRTPPLGAASRLRHESMMGVRTSNAWSLRGFVLEHRYRSWYKRYFGGRNLRVPQVIECFQFVVFQ